jgi:hypothetical protein
MNEPFYFELKVIFLSQLKNFSSCPILHYVKHLKTIVRKPLRSPPIVFGVWIAQVDEGPIRDLLTIACLGL